jgi:hypothetical protein
MRGRSFGAAMAPVTLVRDCRAQPMGTEFAPNPGLWAYHLLYPLPRGFSGAILKQNATNHRAPTTGHAGANRMEVS